MPATSAHPPTAPEPWLPFQRVLAASLLDDGGGRVAVRAARLPLAPGACVVALHVVPPWPMRSRATSAPDARRALERVAAIAADAARAAGGDDPVVPLVAEGWPAIEIVRAAWQERAELVVVGPPAARLDRTHRATVFRVLRRADLPLLVARGDPTRDYARILCAVDGSVTAVDTIGLAIRLGKATARELTIFHAYQIPFEPWTAADGAELAAGALARALSLAQAAAGEVPTVRPWVGRGDPCIAIARAAAEVRADLVVLGTRGRSGVSRALLGSVSEWVIANSRVDVAVARPHRVALEPRARPIA